MSQHQNAIRRDLALQRPNSMREHMRKGCAQNIIKQIDERVKNKTKSRCRN